MNPDDALELATRYGWTHDTYVRKNIPMQFSYRDGTFLRTVTVRNDRISWSVQELDGTVPALHGTATTLLDAFLDAQYAFNSARGTLF